MQKEPLFSRQEIPSDAEPVKFAQSLFVFGILLVVALSFVVEGIFSWIFPVSIPLAGYHALTVYRTGYALGQNTVYHRDRNPIMYNAFLWGSIGYMFVAALVWVD